VPALQLEMILNALSSPNPAGLKATFASGGLREKQSKTSCTIYLRKLRCPFYGTLKFYFAAYFFLSQSFANDEEIYRTACTRSLNGSGKQLGFVVILFFLSITSLSPCTSLTTSRSVICGTQKLIENKDHSDLVWLLRLMLAQC